MTTKTFIWVVVAVLLTSGLLSIYGMGHPDAGVQAVVEVADVVLTLSLLCFLLVCLPKLIYCFNTMQRRRG